jgi:hypothetical protein
MNIDDVKAIVSYHELKHKEQMKKSDELLKYSQNHRKHGIYDEKFNPKDL